MGEFRPSKPGERRGGRQKGTPNKSTAEQRAVIAEAFDGIGGVAALIRWARDNPDDFYTKVWIKTLPKELQATIKSWDQVIGAAVDLPPTG